MLSKPVAANVIRIGAEVSVLVGESDQNMSTSSISSWYRLALGFLGLSSCLYGVAVLVYVSTCPEIGLQCAFSSVIQNVDGRYLEPIPIPPVPGDVLVQVG